MPKVDAIILAGAPSTPDMESPQGYNSRAMIELGGKSMLQWVVDAVGGAPSVGKIAAIGNVNAEGLDLVLEPGKNLVENIKRGIDALGIGEYILVVSSDIPLVTSEAVEDFLQRAMLQKADMVYPILSKSDCEAKYPGLKRTYLRTADGVFTGGNMVLLKPDFVERNWDNIMNAYLARKQVLKLARMIGLGILIRAAFAPIFPGALTVSMLEDAASRMLGAKIAAVVSPYPEIGEDVDKPSDLEAVRKILLEM
jgi:2-phospho-L-lactate guanylyltransferase (CobY/MobA/RfbA family)